MVCRSPLWHLRAAVSAVVRWCSTAVIERWHCGQLVQKENGTAMARLKNSLSIWVKREKEIIVAIFLKKI